MADGLFIVFEGGEGAGKSVQAERLCQLLQEAGRPALLVHEPGTTSLGLYLRDYLKSKRPLTKKAELLLFASARAQLVESQIIPALNEGITIVADRFTASTVAYQGYGRQLGPNGRDVIDYLNNYVTGGIRPHLTFLLDIDPEEGLRRAKQQPSLPLDPEMYPDEARADQDDSRRFEDQSLAFHHRVRNAYLRLAESGGGWHILDARSSIDVLAAQVWEAVAPLLPKVNLDSATASHPALL